MLIVLSRNELIRVRYRLTTVVFKQRNQILPFCTFGSLELCPARYAGDKLDMVSSQLPDDVENPIIFKFSTDMIPIVLLSVQANESQAALYKILDDRVVNPLARIPGVGTVSISGAPQREIQVYCDPNKLEAYNLSIETISSIIGAENKNIPGGNFDIGSETYALRVEGEFDDSRQLADIVETALKVIPR